MRIEVNGRVIESDNAEFCVRAAIDSFRVFNAITGQLTDPSLEVIRAWVISEINRQAAEQRARYRTPNKAETYAQKQRDVDAWDRATGNVTANDVPYAARRAARKNGIPKTELVKVTRPMLEAVITEFKAAIDFLRVKDLDIEDTSEAVIEQVKAATTEAEIETALALLDWSS